MVERYVLIPIQQLNFTAARLRHHYLETILFVKIDMLQILYMSGISWY